jgi:uncharacterized Zn finger protein (UPF0148 family)
MSSDDASDDSGFDKEAEREKLREKYGEDQQDRENTRRMSELLLQGATMTGKHCDQCGDPIFRYDGQEFCPTCQHEVQQAQQGQQGQNAQQAQQGQQGQNAHQTQQARDAQQAQNATADEAEEKRSETEGSESEQPETDESVSGEPRVEIDGIRVADQQPSLSSETASRHADTSNLRQPPSQQGGRDQRRESTNRRNSGEARNSSGMGNRPSTGTHDHAYAGDHAHSTGDHTRRGKPIHDGDANLATARESLVRKLTNLAHRAEETDDVARARELLAATREAAEALDALDRANR